MCSNNIVCCCDFGECAILTLHNRNAVLSTLCGLRVFDEVVRATVSLQVAWRAVHRRRIRRCHERNRRHVFQKWLEAAAAIGAATRARRSRAAVCIQQVQRGRQVRRLPSVCLLRKYMALRAQLTRTRLPAFDALWPGSWSEHCDEDELSETSTTKTYSSDAEPMDIDDVILETNYPHAEWMRTSFLRPISRRASTCAAKSWYPCVADRDDWMNHFSGRAHS